MVSDRTIWIIEDDPGAQFVYKESLSHRYTLKIIPTLTEFETLLKGGAHPIPDLIIADIRLPDGTFLDYLASSECDPMLSSPFMVVSSIDDIDALRFCFEEGALDYLTKPFGRAELVIKVERLLSSHRRRDEALRACYRSSDPKAQKNQLYFDLKDSLTNKESEILALFIETQEAQLSRKYIYETIWKDISVHPKTLDVHLYNLRRKLKTLGYDICSTGTGTWLLSSQRMEG